MALTVSDTRATRTSMLCETEVNPDSYRQGQRHLRLLEEGRAEWTRYLPCLRLLELL